jgi:hypothetical protein
MPKSFYLSILSWFAGTAFAIIMTAIVFKIGWESKERVLIWGMGGLASVTGFLVTFAKQINAAQIKDLEDKIARKADYSDLKTLQIHIESAVQAIKGIKDEQEEERATIDKIYEILITTKR